MARPIMNGFPPGLLHDGLGRDRSVGKLYALRARMPSPLENILEEMSVMGLQMKGVKTAFGA